MIALVALYATALGLVLGGAALAAERAAVAVRRPARAVWVAALAATLAAPALALRSAPVPRATASADGGADARWAALLAAAAARTAERTGAADASAAWARADRALAALWAAATLVLLGRRAAAGARLARHARRWPARVVDGVPVRVAPDAGPAVMGAWRPEIVVPAWLLADPRRALALRHEEAHRRARDPLLLLAADLAVALAPWNAALWWQLVRLRAGVELDCDRRVLGAARADARTYAHLLLDVAGRAPATPLLAPALGGRRSTLERRLRTMTDRPRRPALRALAAAGAALAAVAAAAALPRPTIAAQPPVTPRATPAVPSDSTAPVRVRRGQAPQPLYVVDGRELQARDDSSHAAINALHAAPDRIASMNVLKGEAAARKYGARGRNGVVEITTKAAAAKP